MDRFINALKAHAEDLVQTRAQPRFGTVSSVNVTNGTVRVTLQPENVLTGWLPLLYPWVGNGWGMVCAPAPGDPVLVVAQEGQAEHGVVVGRVYSGQQQPPPAPSGEFWLVHSSGSFFKLTNDGTVQINGDVHVAGDVYDRHGSLSQLRTHYNKHLHTDSRGGLTTPTNQPD